jgi:hypothetical protein
MKTAFLALLLLQAATTTTNAFVVQPSSRMAAVMPLCSDKADEEEGGLDLDLGEMFEMFDAADKDESFDDAIKKVKAEDSSD